LQSENAAESALAISNMNYESALCSANASCQSLSVKNPFQ